MATTTLATNTLAPPATAAATTPLVSVEHVKHLYHKGSTADLLVLDDVDLAAAPRARSCRLLGRSGSGKSTLMRIIAGLMHGERRAR